MKTVFLTLGSALLLAACSSEQSMEVPQPITLTAEAAGHFCQMTVLDHPGPKAQVHLAGLDHPLWFSQVRDALAYDRMPEEAAEVAVIYVSDMSTAVSWDEPGIDNWIDIATAYFVIDSGMRGGMGAPELVPFSTEAMAVSFADEHGGKVLQFDDIDDEMVLAPIDIDEVPPSVDAPGSHHKDAPA